MGANASIVFFVLLAASASSQSSQPASRPALATLGDRVLAEVRAGLCSEDVVEVAWAAWHAGTMRLSPLAPEVERALLRLLHRPASDRWIATIALCEALVALDARVLPTTLRDVWRQAPSVREALMVLAALRDGIIRCSAPYRGAGSWQRTCQERLAALRQQWARVLAGLQSKGLLTDATAAKPDVLRIRVRDERTDKSTPLPRIE